MMDIDKILALNDFEKRLGLDDYDDFIDISYKEFRGDKWKKGRGCVETILVSHSKELNTFNIKVEKLYNHRMYNYIERSIESLVVHNNSPNVHGILICDEVTNIVNNLIIMDHSDPYVGPNDRLDKMIMIGEQNSTMSSSKSSSEPKLRNVGIFGSIGKFTMNRGEIENLRLPINNIKEIKIPNTLGNIIGINDLLEKKDMNIRLQ